jgi:hypothetical protein
MTKQERELLALTRAKQALARAICHLYGIGQFGIVTDLYFKLELLASKIDSIMGGQS